MIMYYAVRVKKKKKGMLQTRVLTILPMTWQTEKNLNGGFVGSSEILTLEYKRGFEASV